MSQPLEPRPPFVFFDGTRGRPSHSWLAQSPNAVLTEVDGEFVELPRGIRVDPVAWLITESKREILAGFVAYESAWHLLPLRAESPRSRAPRLWVGRFDALEPIDDLAFEGDSGSLSEIACDVDAATYAARVAACVEKIWDGDLFEVNYTERFRATWDGSVGSFYERLRRHSTGNYFGLLHTDEFAVASVSPESFLEVSGPRVTARPIKGTRARSSDAQLDAALARELETSEKDRAENVMIVDLMRNDLTRICRPGTVRVPQVCALESFAGVHHLVSTIEGELAPSVSPIEAFLSCFPAGSITGAPKLRAIEIAAEMEHSPRGAYTGSMFVSHPDGWLKSNVLIRTATLYPGLDGHDVEYGAGGAVVSDSVPASEWEEALTKTAPLRRTAR